MLGVEDRNRDWQPAMAALLLLGICIVRGLGQGDPLVAPAFAIALPAASPASIAVQPTPPTTAPLESALGALEAIATAQTTQAPSAGERWITTWGTTMSQASASSGAECCNNQTVRMFMRVSVGGSSVRLRMSNTWGSAPLFLGQVRLALHDRGSEIVPGSDRQVLFAGRSSVEIPIGQTITSDPVSLSVPALADVAISIYAPNETGRVTGVSSWRNGYRVAGDQTRAQGLTGANLTQQRYWVSGIEVLAPSNAVVIAVVSDANTETDSDAGRSWTDFLAPRLQENAATKNRAVVFSGDVYRLLGFVQFPGQSTDAFNEIVSSQTGVQYLMVCPGFPTLMTFALSGGNLTKGISPEERIIRSFKSTIDQARSRGIFTIGCTLAPQNSRVGSEDPTFRDEKGEVRKFDSVRVTVNDWIKSRDAFDAVVDFDAVTHDPANPASLNPEFRVSSDPPVNLFNGRAHQAVANAIDLSLFTR
jgi:hypothetical protein